MSSSSFLIGDLRTAATRTENGTIGWLCLPTFDAGAVFSAQRAGGQGGSFRLDMPDHAATARYLPYSAIVESTHASALSTFLLRDCMLPRASDDVRPQYLIRRLEGRTNATEVRFIFDPRPANASQRCIIHTDGSLCRIRFAERTLWLHLPAHAVVEQRAAKQGLTIIVPLREGETADLILEYSTDNTPHPFAGDPEEETLRFWRQWITEGEFRFSRPHLVQSIIALKLLQFYPTGALLSAVIPAPNADDGRTVRLRDAAFSLYAYSIPGFLGEAKRFFPFLEDIAADAAECEGDVCDLTLSERYTLWGQPLERGMEHASVDLYGALIDAWYLMHRRGLALSPEAPAIIRMLTRGIAARWNDPATDMFALLLGWVGVDRALRLGNTIDMKPKEENAWKTLASSIRQEIDRRRINPDTAATDVTPLLFPLLHFHDRHEESTKQTVRAAINALGIDDTFLRAKHDDAPEAASWFATFCAIAALAATGNVPEAEHRMRKAEERMPSSGLLATGINLADDTPLGGFPDALSHVGYLLAARYLHRYAA